MAEITIPCSIGDKIGYLRKLEDGTLLFIKDEITKIVITKNGIKTGKTKHFNEQDIDDLVDNMKIFKEDGLILMSEPFLMDTDLEDRMDKWFEKVKDNPNLLRKILTD